MHGGQIIAQAAEPLSHAAAMHGHAIDTQLLHQVLETWGCEWIIVIPCIVGAMVYTRGWIRLRQRGVTRFTWSKLALFLGAMACIYVTLESPIDGLADYLLCEHMFQHLLLWFAAPLLIWTSDPFAPCVWGLPAWLRKPLLIHLLYAPWSRAFFRRISHPVAAWPIFVVNLWLWHLPALYDITLHNEHVHHLEHFTFLLTGLLFWWPVILPYPARVRWTAWWLIPYLLLAGIQGTVISAIITFAPHVLYTPYLHVPRIAHISALVDQQLAGGIMWIPGSLVYGTALVWVGTKILWAQGDRGRKRARAEREAIAAMHHRHTLGRT